MITVIVKEPLKQPQIQEIEYSYKKLQELVKGITYVVPFPNFADVDLVTNDDEMIKEKNVNFEMPEYKDINCAFGNVVICSFDKGGKAKSLNSEQIEKIAKYLSDNSFTKKQSDNQM